MRRKDREIIDRAEVLRILADARVCRLAMCDANRPYLVPLSLALDGEDLVLHSAPEGRTLSILRRNPAVCFEVEERVEIDVGPSPCKTGLWCAEWRFPRAKSSTRPCSASTSRS